ncbi:MAG TPA: hypothetical protein VK992_03685 [Candidatus Caenarcaniphilales bacterium]|nr:hypothetical protein [Candidatus Caenarcaniphilales bacterium]
MLGLLVLGTSIVLAGGALDGPRSGAGHRRSPDGATGTGPPRSAGAGTGAPTSSGALAPAVPPPPTLVAPTAQLVTADVADIGGTLPAGIPRNAAYRLRIYVNDELARERPIPPRAAFNVRAIPLEQGENSIRASLVGPDGEGPHSEPVFITLDDTAPAIEVLEPDPGATVHSEDVMIVGRSETGANVTVTNQTTGRQIVSTARDGSFEAVFTLDLGLNDFSLEALDAAGNRSETRLRIIREETSAGVNLTLSHDQLAMEALPETITLTAYVSDDSGAPVDGADVTFSLSPPGQPTSTYRATTNAGVATWRAARVPREGAVTGRGFATVMVVLPAGRALQGSATFTIR